MIMCIDLINKCNLKCRTCVRGIGNMESSNEVMSLDLFEKIIRKARREGIDPIAVYNWTEPFLVDNLHDYIEVIKKNNLTSWVSSNLSLPHINNLEKILCSGVDELFVTVSGHDNNTHQINHVGSDINIVFSNLKKTAEIKQDNKLNLQITLRMLDFSYNKHSEAELAQFANSIGISFYLLPSYGNPNRPIPEEIVSPLDIAMLGEQLEFPLGKVRKREKCHFIHDSLPVDPKGNVFLCCPAENNEKFLIGNYLEMDYGEIFAHRLIHPQCRKCPVDAESYELSPIEKSYIVSIFEKKEEVDETMLNNIFYETTKNLTDEQYLKLLCRAERKSVIDGLQMPGFPSEDIQKGTVGSAGSATLRGEGWKFYKIVKDYADKLNNPVRPETKILDFGCGWGRMIRFYFKDIKCENIYGIDVDPMMIDICKNTLHYGNYLVTTPAPPTEFQNDSFDIIYAYSVFSHLKYDIAEKWIEEFSRILKPGGILVATTQGECSFDYIQVLKDNPKRTRSVWEEYLLKSFDPVEDHRKRYRNGEFLYAATGGGEVRDASFYGEAFIPEQYIKKHFDQYLKLQDFVDNANLLPQALFVMQKRNEVTQKVFNKTTMDEIKIDYTIETCGANKIEGWAWIPDEPGTRVYVRLIGNDNAILHTSKADIHRTDLLETGKGDGTYGFTLQGNFSGWVKELVFFVEDIVSCTISVDCGSDVYNDFLCVHNDDFMYKFIIVHPAFVNNIRAATDYYLNDAKECAIKLAYLCGKYFDSTSKLKLLEFAAGYGRVTRYIDKSRFDITSCDIHPGAVQFISESICVNTLLSDTCPENFQANNQFDVVFALSFFTHMPNKTFGRWMKALYRHVAPGGLLIFSTHGRIANEVALRYETQDGYAFSAASEQGDLSVDDYGTTVSLYEYVEKICKTCIDISPVEWHEGFFHQNIQDVYVVRKPYDVCEEMNIYLDNTEIYRLKTQINKLNDQLTDAAMQSNKLLNDYINITNSRSWRLTKPYRKIGSIIRRVLGNKQ